MLYYETGNGWYQISFARKNMKADAYLICPGPSLADVDATKLRGQGRKIFAINTAYPKIHPDIWMGMDKVECYDASIWNEPFVKICRGAYGDMSIKGRKVKDYDNTYFAHMKPPEPGKSMLDYRQHDSPLMWHNNTMAAMLHLMIWMGAKKIHLVGCDMGGKKDYYDDRKLSATQREYNRKLYKRQIDFLRKLKELADPQGIELISCTPGSPLNKFMVYIPLTDAIKMSERKSDIQKVKIKHALDAYKKVGVIVPTRGDRPGFLKACKEMIKYQTTQPDKVYIVDRKPTTKGNDQRDRIIEGIEKAKKDKVTHVIIMEDDDYYPPTYIEKVLSAWGDEHLVGGYYYNIYHLKDKERTMYHIDMNLGTGVKGSPLHSTSFTMAFWDSFYEAGMINTKQSLDLEIWAWGKQINTKIKLIHDPDLVVSLKHGNGKVAGGNHSGIKEGYGVPDFNMEYFTRMVDPKILKMYKQESIIT